MGWKGRDERVEDLFFEDPTTPGAPTEEGQVRIHNNDLVAFLDGTAKSLTSGTGLSEATHKVLRQLIHFIDEGPAEGFTSGAYKETLPAASIFPTSVIWWESSSKLKKIVEKTITWTGVNPTTIEWEIYDTDGSTVLATITDAISYSGIFETTRTRTIA
jgi:hypothetical protein